MSNRSIRLKIVPELVQLIIIDGLCGAGGFTEGAEQAVDENGNRLAIVGIGVNHDTDALDSHAINHPETIHIREDIRSKKLYRKMHAIVKKLRLQYPNARLLFHCSLECTEFSNAKGGQSRKADSRSLAEHMPNYLKALNPDVFTIENVREFMSWGPLKAKEKKSEDGYACCPIGYKPVYSEADQLIIDARLAAGDMRKHRFKPVGYTICATMVPESRDKGRDYVKWYTGIEDMGYRYSWRLHNTADFGAHTSRTRFFAQFVKPELPVVWPQPTHAKNPETGSGLFGTQPLQKWLPIRECLELDDKGKSIFRNPPLSPKTYERILEGLIRHVGGGDRAFLSKYFTGTGMNQSLDVPAASITTVDHQAIVQAQPFMARLFATASNNHGTYPSDQPASTITTSDGHAMVTPEPFTMTYNSGSPENRVRSMDQPASTLLTENTIALVSSDVFCLKYHGKGDNTYGSDEPSSTLTTNDRIALVQSEQFISRYYSSGKTDADINEPGDTVTTVPKQGLVSMLFIDQQFGKSKPASADDPAPCLTTNPHYALVEAFVSDPQWGGHSHSLDKPSHTIIARQDKAPSSLVFITQRNSGEYRNASVDSPSKTLTTTGGNQEVVTTIQGAANEISEIYKKRNSEREDQEKVWAFIQYPDGSLSPAILVYSSDTMVIRQIKAFMAYYGISDILMRMLKVKELKRIQGFPDYYVLKGSQTLQKKFIGNSIPPKYPKAWITTIAMTFRQLKSSQ